MKKLLALLLVSMMIFSLVACGDNNTTDPNKDNPKTSQSGENNDSGNNGGEENQARGLWDIADTDITILNDGHDVAIIPAGLKKGIGSLSKAQFYLRDPGSIFANTYKSLFEGNYKEVVQADVDELVNYIEQSFGVEAIKGDHSSYVEYVISTDEMELTILHYPAQSNVKVSAYLKGGSADSSTSGVEWPDNEYTAKVPELPASILAICTDTYVVNSLGQCGFSYYNVDPSLEDLQNYMQALKDAGYTVNMNDEWTTDATSFMFYGSDAEGWKVTLTNDYFTIEKSSDLH